MLNVRRILFLSVILLVTACGSPKSETTNNPNAGQDPSNPTSTTPLTVPTNTTDPRLPNLSNAVVLQLLNPNNITDLENIAMEPVFGPLVNGAKLKMGMRAGTNFSLEGKATLFFEDQLGAWFTTIPSVAGASNSANSRIDLYYSDDVMSLRVDGVRNNNEVIASVYYRMRAQGETQCKPVQALTCRLTYPGGYTFEVPYSSGLCGAVPSVDIVTPCKNYLNPTLNPSTVKLLGTMGTTSTLPKDESLKFFYTQILEGN